MNIQVGWFEEMQDEASLKSSRRQCTDLREYLEALLWEAELASDQKPDASKRKRTFSTFTETKPKKADNKNSRNVLK